MGTETKIVPIGEIWAQLSESRIEAFVLVDMARRETEAISNVYGLAGLKKVTESLEQAAKILSLGDKENG